MSSHREDSTDAAPLAIQFYTLVELLHSIRHEARNSISQAHISASLIQRLAKDAPPKSSAHIVSAVGTIQEQLVNVDRLLDRIRELARIETEPTSLDVRTVWQSAVDQLQGRLNHYRINVSLNGDGTVKMPEAPFKCVATNLLINSIDAFHVSRRRSNSRHIRIDIESDRHKPELTKIRYVDNAIGLNLANAGTPNDIFTFGYSTKASGAGVGLWLVRKVLTSSNGAIDIVDYRNGVAFVITLPHATKEA